MGEIVEFCFRPWCDYGRGDLGYPEPHWFPDPFTEEESWPRLYCPACGKPRWLAIDAGEFKERLAVDISPQGTYIEPAGHFVSDGVRAQASDVYIGLMDKGQNLVAVVWDIRVRGEMSVREQFNLVLPDACTLGPSTPCEALICAVCGREVHGLVRVWTQAGIVYVCQHGHFQGECLDPYICMPQHLTGPKMLEVLQWAPELVVPKWKHLWWGPPDINIREHRRMACET